MTTQQKKWLKLRLPLILLAVVIVVGATLGATALGRSKGNDGAAADIATYLTRRGPLTISVSEAGTIQALEQDILKNEVDGQTTIRYLIPEGSIVEEGTLLVELDASRLEDELVDQQIRVQNGEASFVRARENLAVVKNQTQSDIAKAELDYQFAQEDVAQYKDGQYPQEVMEAESRITLAKEELERAANKLEWSKRLHGEKYISDNEYEADRLTHNRAKLDHELAVAALELLKNFTSKRKLAELQSNVDQTRMALERVNLKANADIVQADADLKAAEAEFGQQKQKQTKIEQQIANAKIRAPRAGLVVYATSAKSSWRGNDEPLDEGRSVLLGEELIYLPTADTMMAQVQIHESNLDKVRIGLPVRVTVDAVKGGTYVGRVAKIAPLPNAHSMRMNPDLKLYLTEINIDGKHSELRTGMSCRAEIFIDQHDDALYVPVQAVVRIGHQPMVYVPGSQGPKKRSVEIGLDNNRVVHILSGLEEGEEVLLAPPLEASSTLETDEQPDIAQMEELKKSIEASKRATPPRPGADRPPNQNDTRAPRSGEDRQGAGRGRDMTPEQREEMRKRFESMTPRAAGRNA
ncbi:MAG: HlyD family efflux transporter periplasmic adaptor subunit [Planctomycetota bacterium]